jgi:hypothetical protein
MSMDGPSLVVALLLQCLHGSVDPARLGMEPSTAPTLLGARPDTPVYLAKIGPSRIYQYTSRTDNGSNTDNACSISVYDDVSAPYFQKIVTLLEGPSWRYKVHWHRLKADDNVTEVMELGGPGPSARHMVLILALPPRWRGVSSAFIPGVDYPTLDVLQANKRRFIDVGRSWRTHVVLGTLR